RRAQTRCVHANLAGQRLERGRLDKIATRDEATQAAPPRRDAAEPVFVDEFTVTDEPSWDAGHALVRAVHADDELVVGNRLIDEATPGCVDGYETRLGAVERQMQEGAAPAIEPPSLGDRRPERSRSMILLKERAERARQPNAVPGRAGKRHGVRQRRPHIVVEALNAPAKSTPRPPDHPRARVRGGGFARPQGPPPQTPPPPRLSAPARTRSAKPARRCGASCKTAWRRAHCPSAAWCRTDSADDRARAATTATP